MHGMMDRMAESAATFTLVRLNRETLRRIARFSVVVALLALLAYCMRVTWLVLDDLAVVKLSQCRRALDVVSVRDAVLCLVGFLLARELVRSVARLSRRDDR
jgi:hypothetical protein